MGSSPEFRAREHLVERRVVRLEVRLDRVVGLALDRAARDEALHRRVVGAAHLDAEALGVGLDVDERRHLLEHAL